jgi:hypothetical protein
MDEKSSMIDWEEIRTGFNREYNADFETLCELLKVLYIETKSTTRMKDIIGVSSFSLRTKMKGCGIIMAKQGGNNFLGVYKKLILDTPDDILKTMSAYGIADMVGCTHRHVRKVCNRNGLEYKKLNVRGNDGS